MSRARLPAAAALFLAAAGCSNALGPTAEQAYGRGMAALEAGRPRLARVELLNAIKADPDDPAIRLAQARTYLLLGDGVAAEAELRRALATGAAAADLHHLLAHALLLQGRAKEAADEAARAPAVHAGYAGRIRGRALMALGDRAAADAAFRAAVASAPGDPDLWTEIARFRRETGDAAGAVADADQALSLDPEHVEALTLRGELTRRQYGLAAALPWFDRALELDPDHLVARLERAATLADLGRARDSLADTRHALSLSPGHPTAHYLQALLAARAGNFDLARRLWERTKGAMDGQPAGLLLAAAIELETGSYVQAAGRLDRLVAIQPENGRARRLLALARWRLGDPAAAATALRPLAERPDADSWVLALMARTAEKQGRGDEAERYLARARSATGGAALLDSPHSQAEFAALRSDARARPGDAGLQVRLISALLARGLTGEALERARSVQKLHPGVPDSHVLVGDALGLGGDFPAAAREYRRAANLAFTEPVALRLIEALRRSGDTEGAADTLALFLEQNPQNVPAQLVAAHTLIQSGRWSEAIAVYERVRARIGDGDAALLNNLAWAHARAGDEETAIALAHKAWALDRGNPATAETLGRLLYRTGRDRVAGLALLRQAALRR